MKLGKDFFFILRIVWAVTKALIELFGDDDDRAEAKANGF